MHCNIISVTSLCPTCLKSQRQPTLGYGISVHGWDGGRQCYRESLPELIPVYGIRPLQIHVRAFKSRRGNPIRGGEIIQFEPTMNPDTDISVREASSD